MKFLELKKRDGTRFLFDPDSGWEIYDNGSAPALWSNAEQARNLDCADTFEDIRAQLPDA